MFADLRVGGWAYGEILTSTQMNQLNDDLPFALDGRDGGSYTPTDDLDLQTPITKTIALNGCTFDSVADGGGAQCTGDLDVGGDFVVSGITVAQGVSVANLGVNGNATIGTSSGDTVTVNGATTLNALTTAKFRIRAMRGVQRGVDNGTTGQYAFETYDILYIEPGHAVSASTVWQIHPTTVPIPGAGGTQAEIMSFRHLGTGSAIDVKDPAGTTLATIGPLTSGNLIQVDVAWQGSASAYFVIGHVYMA